MRVTNAMVANTVIFNTQRSLSRYLDLESKMSTGRKINAPSDDPMGTIRDLDYRTELAKIEQYQKNISSGLTWQTNYETILADLKNMTTDAKELAIAMANDTYGDTERAAAASEIDSIFDRMIQLANSELEGKSVFSGFRTDAKALVATAYGATYMGDNGQIDFAIESGSRQTVNLNGADVFLAQLSPLGSEADFNLGVAANTLLADLHGGDGIDQLPGTFTITDRNLGLTSTINISGAGTVQNAINTINVQLAMDGITDVVAALGPDGNNIMLDTTASGRISNVTDLGVLNSGNGIDLQPGSILVSDGGATSVEVDLSGASTIGDVVTLFNSQMAAAGVANVTMQINAAGTGFEINDTNGVPLGLSISDVAGTESTAANLGIVGRVDPTLAGTGLQPTVSFSVAEVSGTTAADLGIDGDFFGDFTGNDLNPALSLTANIADLNNGLGLELGDIQIWQGNASRTLNLSDPGIVTVQDLIDTFNNSGLDITASLNEAGTGIQIVNDDPYSSLTIKDPEGTEVSRLLGIYGSTDMMGSMMLLSDAMHSDDRPAIELLLQNLDESIQELLTSRASVGAKTIGLETTSARMSDLELKFTELLSDTEDADLTQLVTDLATYENNYQASLMATAKIIQPTLLDFLS